MNIRTMWARCGIAAGTAGAALALVAIPQASASSAATSVHGFGNMTFNGVGDSVVCSDEFTGRVTSDDGSNLKASIGSFSIGCQGATVTANSLPWNLDLTRDRGFTLSGFSVNITTAQGTCRYSGSLRGDFQFPPGIYSAFGSLTRQSDGCGGAGQISVSSLSQNIGII